MIGSLRTIVPARPLRSAGPSTSTDKVTERALASFTPAERETVIRALQDIGRNLTAD